MNTHTIDSAATQDARRLMNRALLRAGATAALSVLFALIHCAMPVDGGPGLASPAAADTFTTVTQAAAAMPAD